MKLEIGASTLQNRLGALSTLFGDLCSTRSVEVRTGHFWRRALNMFSAGCLLASAAASAISRRAAIADHVRFCVIGGRRLMRGEI
jgi:hypothetical protein